MKSDMWIDFQPLPNVIAFSMFLIIAANPVYGQSCAYYQQKAQESRAAAARERAIAPNSGQSSSHYQPAQTYENAAAQYEQRAMSCGSSGSSSSRGSQGSAAGVFGAIQQLGNLLQESSARQEAQEEAAARQRDRELRDAEKRAALRQQEYLRQRQSDQSNAITRLNQQLDAELTRQQLNEKIDAQLAQAPNPRLVDPDCSIAAQMLESVRRGISGQAQGSQADETSDLAKNAARNYQVCLNSLAATGLATIDRTGRATATSGGRQTSATSKEESVALQYNGPRELEFPALPAGTKELEQQRAVEEAQRRQASALAEQEAARNDQLRAEIAERRRLQQMQDDFDKVKNLPIYPPGQFVPIGFVPPAVQAVAQDIRDSTVLLTLGEQLGALKDKSAEYFANEWAKFKNAMSNGRGPCEMLRGGTGTSREAADALAEGVSRRSQSVRSPFGLFLFGNRNAEETGCMLSIVTKEIGE